MFENLQNIQKCTTLGLASLGLLHKMKIDNIKPHLKPAVAITPKKWEHLCSYPNVSPKDERNDQVTVNFVFLFRGRGGWIVNEFVVES